MSDVPVSASLALVARTYPFVLIRTAVYLGIAAAFTVAAGGGASLGWAVGAIAGAHGRLPGAFWGAIGGMAVVVLMLRWLREYLLFLVKAGHLAAVVRVLDRRPGADGFGQVGPAIDGVQRSFREMGDLLEIERLAQGTLNDLLPPFATRLFDLADGSLMATLVTAGSRLAFRFAREAILGAVLRAPPRNPWREAREALVLFAQNHAALFRPTLALAAAMHGIALLAFLIALLPAGALAQSLPGDPIVIALVLAAVFAWCFKQALLEPLAVAALIQIYFRAVDGQAPDPEWDLRLGDLSDHFRELTARAGTRRAPRRSTNA